MRFEIRAGGTFLILLGLLGLSGSVFVLGLVSGYEMGSQAREEANRVATVYPLESPAATPSPAEAALNPVPSAPAATPSPGSLVASASKPVHPPVAPPRNPLTGAEKKTTPAINEPATPASESEAGEPTAAPTHFAPPSPAKVVSNAVPPRPRSKPYNIQIEAVMDHTGAEQMAGRLRQLGYQATITESDIGGRTWYRVRVGPYGTEEEAREAEQKLRERYESTFGGGARTPASSGD
jgi:cell division protein FtsN